MGVYPIDFAKEFFAKGNVRQIDNYGSFRCKFVYPYFTCYDCCFGCRGHKLLTIGDNDFWEHTTSLNNNCYWVSDVINSFCGLVAHSVHSCKVAFMDCSMHSLSVSSEVTKFYLPMGMTEIVSVACDNLHYVVLHFDLVQKKVLILDGLNMHSSNHWKSQWNYIVNSLMGEIVENWSASVSADFQGVHLPQVDDYNCGPLACAKVWNILEPESCDISGLYNRNCLRIFLAREFSRLVQRFHEEKLFVPKNSLPKSPYDPQEVICPDEEDQVDNLQNDMVDLSKGDDSNENIFVKESKDVVGKDNISLVNSEQEENTNLGEDQVTSGKKEDNNNQDIFDKASEGDMGMVNRKDDAIMDHNDIMKSNSNKIKNSSYSNNSNISSYSNNSSLNSDDESEYDNASEDGVFKGVVNCMKSNSNKIKNSSYSNKIKNSSYSNNSNNSSLNSDDECEYDDASEDAVFSPDGNLEDPNLCKKSCKNSLSEVQEVDFNADHLKVSQEKESEGTAWRVYTLLMALADKRKTMLQVGLDGGASGVNRGCVNSSGHYSQCYCLVQLLAKCEIVLVKKELKIDEGQKGHGFSRCFQCNVLGIQSSYNVVAVLRILYQIFLDLQSSCVVVGGNEEKYCPEKNWVMRDKDGNVCAKHYTIFHAMFNPVPICSNNCRFELIDVVGAPIFCYSTLRRIMDLFEKTSGNKFKGLFKAFSDMWLMNRKESIFKKARIATFANMGAIVMKGRSSVIPRASDGPTIYTREKWAKKCTRSIAMAALAKFYCGFCDVSLSEDYSGSKHWWIPKSGAKMYHGRRIVPEVYFWACFSNVCSPESWALWQLHSVDSLRNSVWSPLNQLLRKNCPNIDFACNELALDAQGTILEMKGESAFCVQEDNTWIIEKHAFNVYAFKVEEDVLKVLLNIFNNSFDFMGHVKVGDGLVVKNAKRGQNMIPVNGNSGIVYSSSSDFCKFGIMDFLGYSTKKNQQFAMDWPDLDAFVKKNLYKHIYTLLKEKDSDGIYEVYRKFRVGVYPMNLGNFKLQHYQLEFSKTFLRESSANGHHLFIAYMPLEKNGMWLRILPGVPFVKGANGVPVVDHNVLALDENAWQVRSKKKKEKHHSKEKQDVEGSAKRKRKDNSIRKKTDVKIIDGRWLYIPWGQYVVLPASLYHSGMIRTSACGNKHVQIYVYAENQQMKVAKGMDLSLSLNFSHSSENEYLSEDCYDKEGFLKESTFEVNMKQVSK